MKSKANIAIFLPILAFLKQMCYNMVDISIVDKKISNFRGFNYES